MISTKCVSVLQQSYDGFKTVKFFNVTDLANIKDCNV